MNAFQTSFNVNIWCHLRLALFLLYVDDLVINFQHQDPVIIIKTLNRTLSRIHDWSLANLISIHTKKTVFMFLRKSRDSVTLKQEDKVFIGNEEITRVITIRYLGLLIDSCVTFKAHFNHLQNRL